jgi:hypothetical protein
MGYFPDSDQVEGLFWEGESQQHCLAALERDWGSPQPSVESIDPQVIEEAEYCVPTVWYYESLP